MKTLKSKIFFFIPSITVLLIVALFIFSTGFKKETPFTNLKKGDTTMLDPYYVELKGTVRESKMNEKEEITPIDSALIKVFLNGAKPYEIFTNKKGKCSFKLPLGKSFKIEVSKKNFVTKFFEVKTNVPFDKVDIYNYNFEIDIFEDIKGLDLSVLKNPVAKVSFDLISGQFAYDDGYTNRLNKDLKKMYKNYYELKKIDKDLMDNPQKLTEPSKQN